MNQVLASQYLRSTTWTDTLLHGAATQQQCETGCCYSNQHWHLQKHPQAQAQRREQKRARRSAAGCTQKVKDIGTQGTVQALPCLNGMGNWQSQCQGIICIKAGSRPQALPLQPLFSPFPQDQAFRQVIASPDGPVLTPCPSAVSPLCNLPGHGMGWAVGALQLTRTRSIRTASAEPASHFIHLQTYISPG